MLKNLHEKRKFKKYSWNFGPKISNNKSVIEVVVKLNTYFGNLIKIVKKPVLMKNYHESKMLMLNSKKANNELKWLPKYNLEYSLKLVADWYKIFFLKGDLFNISQNQILEYFKKIK